ncbi:hypothetical protein DL98DRAFT_518308 [Cadophora sp. DSE1049]|nr:hypothetical protein DL98DRAFT_518308 [Cadophora sp. DSE1049]
MSCSTRSGNECDTKGPVSNHVCDGQHEKSPKNAAELNTKVRKTLYPFSVSANFTTKTTNSMEKGRGINPAPMRPVFDTARVTIKLPANIWSRRKLLEAVKTAVAASNEASRETESGMGQGPAETGSTIDLDMRDLSENDIPHITLESPKDHQCSVETAGPIELDLNGHISENDIPHITLESPKDHQCSVESTGTIRLDKKDVDEITARSQQKRLGLLANELFQYLLHMCQQPRSNCSGVNMTNGGDDGEIRATRHNLAEIIKHLVHLRKFLKPQHDATLETERGGFDAECDDNINGDWDYPRNPQKVELDGRATSCTCDENAYHLPINDLRIGSCSCDENTYYLRAAGLLRDALS